MASSTSIPKSSSSSTRPGRPPTWREAQAAPLRASGYAPPFPTAIHAKVATAPAQLTLRQRCGAPLTRRAPSARWEYTLAELLRDAGYQSVAFGKWHLGDKEGRYPTNQGFDEWWAFPIQVARRWTTFSRAGLRISLQFNRSCKAGAANRRSSSASKLKGRPSGTSPQSRQSGLVRRPAVIEVRRGRALLRRADGASIVDLTEATGWLPHTTRAALTGLRKRGYAVVRERVGAGDSVYRISYAAADDADHSAAQTDAADGQDGEPKPRANQAA